ncbi:MAG: hypothetical protein H6625_11980 [Bdellovibrionaceae bacterium]|nr:hypothetical protein [Pseudobdellovibrionaceae bacterium]
MKTKIIFFQIIVILTTIPSFGNTSGSIKKLVTTCERFLTLTPILAEGRLLLATDFAYDYEGQPNSLANNFINPDSKEASLSLEDLVSADGMKLIVWEAIAEQVWHPDSRAFPGRLLKTPYATRNYIAQAIQEIEISVLLQVTKTKIVYFDSNGITRSLTIDPTFNPNQIEKIGPFIDSLDRESVNSNAIDVSWTGKRVIGYFVTVVSGSAELNERE